MTDIVAELRRAHPQSEDGELRHRAADTIERLRAALEPFAEASRKFDAAMERFKFTEPSDDLVPKVSFTHRQLRAARAALTGESET